MFSLTKTKKQINIQQFLEFVMILQKLIFIWFGFLIILPDLLSVVLTEEDEISEEEKKQLDFLDRLSKEKFKTLNAFQKFLVDNQKEIPTIKWSMNDSRPQERKQLQELNYYCGRIENTESFVFYIPFSVFIENVNNELKEIKTYLYFFSTPHYFQISAWEDYWFKSDDITIDILIEFILPLMDKSNKGFLECNLKQIFHKYNNCMRLVKSDLHKRNKNRFSLKALHTNYTFTNGKINK